MATRKTLQRQFLGPRYSPSSEAEMGVFNQAQSGMSALSQNLNQMTNFFFKEMETRVQEEGALYGATNPITLEQIKKANQTGEDVFKGYGYGTKGKFARSAALEGLVLDVETQAVKSFTELDIQAKANKISPEEYGDQLDATILGFTSLTKNFPEVNTKLKASLSVTANGYLKDYYKEIAKQDLENDKRKFTEMFQVGLDKLPKEITAIVDAGGSINDLYVKHNRDLSDAAQILNVSRSTLEGSLKDYRKDFVQTLYYAAAQEALINDKASDDAEALIINGRTGNKKIDAIYNFLKPEEKKKLEQYLMDEDKKLSNAKKRQVENIESEDKINSKRFDDAIVSDNYELAEKILPLLPLKIQNDKITELDKRGSSFAPLIQTQEQIDIENNLIEKGNNGSLTSADLLDNRENIKDKTFQDLSKKIQQNNDNLFTKQTQIFKNKYKLDVSVEGLNKDEKSDRQIASQIIDDVFQEYLAASKKGEYYDVKANLDKKEKSLITTLKEEAFKELVADKENILNKVAYFKYGGQPDNPKQTIDIDEAITFLTKIIREEVPNSSFSSVKKRYGKRLTNIQRMKTQLDNLIKIRQGK